MGASFDELLAARRMCRDFDGTPVPPEVVEAVVRAATRAPSAGNTHALDVVVLRGDETRAYWDTTLPAGRRGSFPWPGLLRAPVLALPYVDPEAYVRRYAEEDKAHAGLGGSTGDWPVPYWFVDGGAAVMAMLLAAADAGLGALLFGQFGHEEALRARLGVPPGRRALGTVALGHPGPDAGRRAASAARGRPDLDEVLHHGRW